MSALSEIQKKLKVPKGQYNQFGKYKYRTCGDILEAVKKVLPEGYSVVLSDSIEMIGDRYYVKANAALVCDSDPSKSVAVTAFARESFDKKGMDDSQITGAASSYARKYALNGLFAIDDTADADTLDNTEHETKSATDVEYAKITEKYADSITVIKEGIANNDLSTAAEAWFELDEEVKRALWRAPTKGGCFTIPEVKVIKSAEFRQAHFGSEEG